MTLSASASDSDGTIAKVEFYNGTTLLGTDTAAPYTYTWSSVAAGTYTLKAIAYDNSGASTSSATSTITVSTVGDNAADRRRVHGVADHATLVTSYELRIYAAGADPNTATPIATSNLGKPTPDANNNITVDLSAFFSALGLGITWPRSRRLAREGRRSAPAWRSPVTRHSFADHQHRLEILAVHTGDVGDRNLLRAYGLALAFVGAAAESFSVVPFDHLHDARKPLDCSLRQ